MKLPDLESAADMVCSQFERYDETGFPKKVAAQNIPIGTRILALHSDFESLLIGTLAPRRITPEDAQIIIVYSSGKRYDPSDVEAFVELMRGTAKGDTESLRGKEIAVSSANMEPDMILSRDLITPNGLLMLSVDHALDERFIRKIMDFERSAGIELSAYVHQASAN